MNGDGVRLAPATQSPAQSGRVHPRTGSHVRSYQITSRKRLDLSPVFGRLEREQEDRVLGHLHVAHERLQALMRALAERTGSQWTTGVELQLFGLGQACICGSVETPPGASFELTFEAVT